MEPKVVFVDDEKPVLDAYRRTLRRERKAWQAVFFDCPIGASEALSHLGADVVVADMYMPGITGMQLLNRIKEDPRTADVPVIIVTGHGEDELKSRALESGATDLLQKPVNADVMLARISNAVRLKEHSDLLRDQHAVLNRKVTEQTAEISRSRLEVIWRLAKAAEARDGETGRHVVRVGLYCKLIAEAYGADEDLLSRISAAACLHDVGKIGISDNLLRKPGKLTCSERQEINKHCEIGHTILSQRVENALFGDNLQNFDLEGATDPTLALAAEIALCHHERWDGDGYPQNLHGENIPLPARITAVADVYDALRSRRAYKKERSLDQTLHIMGEEVGAHFDPNVYDAFLTALGGILAVECQYADHVLVA